MLCSCNIYLANLSSCSDRRLFLSLGGCGSSQLRSWSFASFSTYSCERMFKVLYDTIIFAIEVTWIEVRLTYCILSTLFQVQPQDNLWFLLLLQGFVWNMRMIGLLIRNFRHSSSPCFQGSCWASSFYSSGPQTLVADY